MQFLTVFYLIFATSYSAMIYDFNRRPLVFIPCNRWLLGALATVLFTTAIACALSAPTLSLVVFWGGITAFCSGFVLRRITLFEDRIRIDFWFHSVERPIGPVVEKSLMTWHLRVAMRTLLAVPLLFFFVMNFEEDGISLNGAFLRLDGCRIAPMSINWPVVLVKYGLLSVYLIVYLWLPVLGEELYYKGKPCTSDGVVERFFTGASCGPDRLCK